MSRGPFVLEPRSLRPARRASLVVLTPLVLGGAAPPATKPEPDPACDAGVGTGGSPAPLSERRAVSLADCRRGGKS